MTSPNYDEMRDFQRNAHGARPRLFNGPGSIRRLIAEAVASLLILATPFVFIILTN